jgi:hypothetical protein
MKKSLALALLLCLILSISCRAEADPVVAEVGSTKILRSQVEAEMATAEVIYGFLGQNLTEDEIAVKKAQAQKEILEQLILRQVLLDQAEARGIRLEGDVRKAADTKYTATLDSVRDYVLQSYPSLSGGELDEQVDTLLKAAGETRDSLRAEAGEAALTDALYQSVYDECASVPEADVKARYDALYSEQKQAFDGNVNGYEAALLEGGVIVHRPVDEKMIQKAEFLFDVEIIPLLNQMNQYGSAEDAQAMTDDQYALLTDKVEDIYEDLKAGKIPFDQVLEGIEPGSSQKVNYFSEGSTRFPDEYRSRALRFKTVGEISTAYKIDNGYAILYYAGDLPKCDAVPLSEVRDRIEVQLLGDARKSHLEDALAGWMRGANVVRYEENLK